MSKTLMKIGIYISYFGSSKAKSASKFDIFERPHLYHPNMGLIVYGYKFRKRVGGGNAQLFEHFRLKRLAIKPKSKVVEICLCERDILERSVACLCPIKICINRLEQRVRKSPH